SSSYVGVLNRAKDINGLYQDDNENGYTYRNYEDNLLIGGLDHRTGRLDDKDKYSTLSERAGDKKLAGDMTHYWSANDCITFDALPFIGYYSKCSKDIFIISGFNKWGMANAMVGASLLCDMIYCNHNKYEALFSPQRRLPFNCDFLRNALCVVKNLVIKPLLLPCRSYESLNLGEGDIVMYHGRKRAVYKDENGELHINKPLCAHLKCQLQFNAVDRTWDCPCHGSRFDIDGNVMTAPSVKNLEKIDSKK
ncbi:MAG: FAD-dependent oxidoreductase, partial [Clostridia bacterium]|nr:FAD-dependent oxidoreductase [Clostridia bacterium]